MGVALGCAATLVVARAVLRARVGAVAGERDAALAAADAARGRADRLDEANRALDNKVTRLSTQLEEKEASDSQRKELVDTVRSSVVSEVKVMCGEAMRDQSGELVKLARSEFKTARVEASADLEARQKAVEQLVEPLANAVTNIGERIDTLDRAREKSQADLGGQIRALVESGQDLRRETGALARALHQPHVRGAWGELHLQRAVELAGMVEHVDFVRQSQRDDDGRVLRPDMVAKLPTGKAIVVDAKAPVAPLVEAHQLEDGQARAAQLQLFAKGVRAHANKLGAKRYWDQFDTSPELVLMYLPGDHFLSEALRFEPTLIEDASRNCVFIVTPATLMVTLRTVAFVWQQEMLTEEARAIGQLGRTIYSRLGVFLGLFNKLGRALNTSVEAYNRVAGSLERRLLPAARRLPQTGAVGSDVELPDVQGVDLRAREVQAPELVERSVADVQSNGPSRDEADENTANSGHIASGELPDSEEGWKLPERRQVKSRV
ncbi:MAG: DNA recombination protein RmuC [Thermoleophilaceae bacterium]